MLALQTMDHAMTETQKPRLAIELPDHERGRGPDDVQRFDRLNARLKRADLTPKQREAALKERDRIETAPMESADAAWRDKAICETEKLATARGEEITEDKAGVKRILDRDPLLSLARAGHITPEQLETGQAIRELYDSRAQDAGAMEYTGMPSGGHNHEQFVASRFTRAKASAMVVRIEMAVHVSCSAEPACLVMLREVCQRGMSVRSISAGGRQFTRNCTAFARALDVADAVLRRQM